MINTVLESFKKLKNLSNIDIGDTDNIDETYEEYFNNCELSEADIIIENTRLDTKKIRTKSSIQLRNLEKCDIDKIRRSKLKFLIVALKQKNLDIFSDIAKEVYYSNNTEYTKELIDISMPYIPKEENNKITSTDAKISSFGEQILSSNELILKEKKFFIKKVHDINPKFSKDMIAKFNLNNMHKDKSISDEIDFYEILSYFNDIAKFGNPDNPVYISVKERFPINNDNINYAPLFIKTMMNIPNYKQELSKFNSVEDYKNYKNNARNKSSGNKIKGNMINSKIATLHRKLEKNEGQNEKTIEKTIEKDDVDEKTRDRHHNKIQR